MDIINEKNEVVSVNEGTREDPGLPVGELGKNMLHRMNTAHGVLRDWALPLVSWRPGMRILDAGCGGGATIQQMLDLAPDSRIDGIDYSALCVEESSQLNAPELGKRVHIQQANVLTLPFEDNTFDLVTAVETVYFWPSIEDAFREVCRVLKPDGIFAVLNEGSDPANCDWPQPENSTMRIYYPEELTTLMAKAGFSASEVAHGEEQLILVQGRK